jgi:hypothetical protein
VLRLKSDCELEVASRRAPNAARERLLFRFVRKKEKSRRGIGTSKFFRPQKGGNSELGQDSESKLQHQGGFVARAKFVLPCCIKVTPASLLIVM